MDLSKTLQGKRSRSEGEFFESMIETACGYYESRKICAIDKTPEPMKILKPYDRGKGQFITCFAKQAQPDFKGALMDATMVLFDAKHTDKGQISRSVVTSEQEENFERYSRMGAFCFLVISLGFRDFYRVPWEVFRDMKKIFGHKYMDKRDLFRYQIPFEKGILRFLDGIELRGSNDED